MLEKIILPKKKKFLAFRSSNLFMALSISIFFTRSFSIDKIDKEFNLS